MKRAVIAEPAILEQTGCQVEKMPYSLLLPWRTEPGAELEVLVHPSGWKFHAFHRHILAESERQAASKAMRRGLKRIFPILRFDQSLDSDDDDIWIDEYKLHVPAMIFGVDLMFLSFLNHGGVHISAEDALFCWLFKHCDPVTQEHPLNVIKVPQAKKWASILSTSFGNDSTATASATDGQTQSNPVLTAVRPCDWTYSTDYCGSFITSAFTDNVPSVKQILHGRSFSGRNTIDLPVNNNDTTFSSNWSFTPVTESGIDFNMLRKRDLPILFYDEITLYEDDLEDCGEMCVEAKLRVMPTCWFILLKCFLRIDNVVARCYETRLYHAFPATDRVDPVVVNVEVVWREKSLVDDIAAMPVTVMAIPGMPTPPMTSVRYTKENTNNLPMVNEREGIQQFYTVMNVVY